MEEWWREHVGLVCVRCRAQSSLLLNWQSWNVESIGTSRRRQMVDDHLRAKARYRHGEVGIPDDAVGRVGLRRNQRTRAGRFDDWRKTNEGAHTFRPQRVR